MRALQVWLKRVGGWESGVQDGDENGIYCNEVAKAISNCVKTL